MPLHSQARGAEWLFSFQAVSFLRGAGRLFSFDRRVTHSRGPDRVLVERHSVPTTLGGFAMSEAVQVIVRGFQTQDNGNVIVERLQDAGFNIKEKFSAQSDRG